LCAENPFYAQKFVITMPECGAKVTPYPEVIPEGRWCEAEFPSEWGALPEWKHPGPNLPLHFVEGPDGDPVPDPRLLAVMGPHMEMAVNQGKPLKGNTNAQELVANHPSGASLGLPNLAAKK
jgi:hypothetical protein